MATRTSLVPGKHIFKEGERADFVFGVSEGVVRLFKLLPDGRRQIVWLALPGEFLEMPAVGRHLLSATAVGEIVLHRFPREPLEAYILSNANLTRLLIEFATRRLENAQQQLLVLGNGSAEERVLFFLITWRNRQAIGDQTPDYVPLPMKREDIADFLALTLETVSRTLKRLERNNFIRIVPKGAILGAARLTACVADQGIGKKVKNHKHPMLSREI